jgi:predicted nucleotidyltransferase
MGGPAASYPSFASVHARRLEARRDEAVRTLRAAEALAKREGGRLVVFGSLVEGGFNERSDIDVAVLGLDPPDDSRVAVEVDTLLASAGFAGDVIPERFLCSSLRRRIQARGREPGALD